MKCCISCLLFLSTLFNANSFCQCKTYQLNAKKDTINCTDFNDSKQGYWYTKVTDNHGEPGYQEEGHYTNNKKEGAWTRYNLMGDVIAEENYKWGYKDGINRYYNIIGILREESWRAINPKNPYDTVRAYHLDNPDKYDLKIIKVDASTVKHGTWNFYDPERQTIVKSEEYIIDQLVSNKKPKLNITDSVVSNNKTDSLSIANKNKPAEVLQYEKKNQKKKIKVRDGATGVN